MSSITIEELKKLPAESYQIIDVRDEIEISHGAVKGALACKPEEIMENPASITGAFLVEERKKRRDFLNAILSGD